MFLLYFAFWVGFIAGSLALGAFLVVSAVRVLVGWRPSAASPQLPRVVAALVGGSLLGFAYGTWMWVSFEPDDANRALTAVPPIAFGVLALVTAASVAVARSAAHRTGAPPAPGQRQHA